jgi:TonB family protein
MRSASFFAAVLALLPAFAAAADPRPAEDELARRPARVTVFVPPEFPAQALRDGVEATVDVVGTVRGDGSLVIRRVDAIPDREDFRAAVTQVSKYWMFRPSYGFDCGTREVEARLRVWFEIKVGGPAISVSFPDRAATPAPGVDAPARLGRAGTEFAPTYRPNPPYPNDAITRRAQGKVDALMRVGADGRVEQVVIVPDGHPRLFDNTVNSALSAWRFPPRAGAAGLPRCVEVVVDYVIAGGPGSPANAKESVTVR